MPPHPTQWHGYHISRRTYFSNTCLHKLKKINFDPLFVCKFHFLLKLSIACSPCQEYAPSLFHLILAVNLCGGYHYSHVPDREKEAQRGPGVLPTVTQPVPFQQVRTRYLPWRQWESTSHDGDTGWLLMYLGAGFLGSPSSSKQSDGSGDICLWNMSLCSSRLASFQKFLKIQQNTYQIFYCPPHNRNITYYCWSAKLSAASINLVLQLTPYAFKQNPAHVG